MNVRHLTRSSRTSRQEVLLTNTSTNDGAKDEPGPRDRLRCHVMADTTALWATKSRKVWHEYPRVRPPTTRH